jgi:hypothetical protein
MPSRIILFNALRDWELHPWFLLPGRLHCECIVRSWTILQHNHQTGQLHSGKLLSLRFNRDEPVPYWKLLWLSFNNCSMRVGLVLSAGFNAADALRLWKFLPKHYSPNPVSSRDCVRRWCYKHNSMSNWDVL